MPLQPLAPTLFTNPPKPNQSPPLWKTAAEQNAALMDEEKRQAPPPPVPETNQPATGAWADALRTPQYGAERYIEEGLNKAGGRALNGRRRKPQFAYQDGPLKGMTQDQATEHLRAQYAALPDAERMRYEDQANRNDITSPREREMEQQYFNAQARARGLESSPMAATSAGAQRPAALPTGSGFTGVAGAGRNGTPFALRSRDEVASRNRVQPIGSSGRVESVSPAPMSRPRLEPGGMTSDMARDYAANVNPDGTLRRPKPVLTQDRIQVPRPGAGMQSTLDTTAPPPSVPGSTPSMESAGPRQKAPVIRDKPLSAAPVLGGGIRASSPAGQSLSRTFDSAPPALPAARTKNQNALDIVRAPKTHAVRAPSPLIADQPSRTVSQPPAEVPKTMAEKQAENAQQWQQINSPAQRAQTQSAADARAGALGRTAKNMFSASLKPYQRAGAVMAAGVKAAYDNSYYGKLHPRPSATVPRTGLAKLLE